MNGITTSSRQKPGKELRAFIMRAVYERLHDPDFGRELTESAKKRLGVARSSKGKTTSFADIKKRYL